MRLARYGQAGQERPAIVDDNGVLRDLGSHVDDIAGEALSQANLERLARLDVAALPPVPASARLGPCVGRIGNFISVGLNYRDHALESNVPIPEEPILFNKHSAAASGANDPIVLMRGSVKTDWEVEVAIVIGAPAYLVSEAEALSHVAGLCICHDVSERTFQLERGGQWMKGKSGPGYGPLGPWLVTLDELADVRRLSLWLDVNGERMQTGNTSEMIFGFATLASYISQFMKLLPGDVITTGTPPGVGMARTPPRFLRAGDVVTLGVDGLGAQRQVVEPHRPA